MVGQTAAVCWVHFGLHLRLPLVPVFGLILFTAVTNAALYFVRAEVGRASWILTGVLALDVLVLTGLLYLTGGSHNPFSSFYLVQVALAAVALRPVQTGLIALLSAMGVATLFMARGEMPKALDVLCGVGPEMPLQLHLRGMLVSFVLTAGCIAVFATRLQNVLRARELELAKAREQALRQEQFAALATLAAGAAHELGTPIGTISVAAGEIVRVSRETTLPSEVVEDAELIREEASRCRGILDRLHQSAGDPPKPMLVELLFDRLRARLGGQIGRVRFEPVPHRLAVLSPNEALVQASLSLIRNAMDAAVGGQPVVVQALGKADRVVVTVTDWGEGLSERVRAHAGEPFFTTKRPGAGMGLGLFLVRLVAERVGGTLRLEDNAPQGTRAVLELPAAV